MKDNLIKIGYSSDPERRRKDLSHQSGVAADYELYATYEIPVKLADKDVHKLIQTLNPELRYNPSKEFFIMKPEDAYKVFEVFANIHDRKSFLVKYFNGQPILPEIDNGELDTCIEDVEKKNDVEVKNIMVYCKSKDANASGIYNGTNIIVKKGSVISKNTAPSFPERYSEIRNELINNGSIDNYRFTKDVELNPSRASTIILGRSSNGNTDWKTEDGVKLKNL